MAPSAVAMRAMSGDANDVREGRRGLDSGVVVVARPHAGGVHAQVLTVDDEGGVLQVNDAAGQGHEGAVVVEQGPGGGGPPAIPAS